MEFLLLGPLIVRRGDEVLPVRRGKQRAVLAALLLQANRIVSVDQLAEALWDGDKPLSAQVTVQNYVKRLRQALGDGEHRLISTQPHGYMIRVQPGDLDVTQFGVLLKSAQSAARQSLWETAAEQASAALALWRGEPLADVESELLLRRHAPRLAEMRLQAEETRIDACLHLGRHAELIGDLRQLTAGHPLRERFWALLMLALFRSGRQADALAAYQQARTALVGQLGAEPGAELRAVHRQVLAGDDGMVADSQPRGAARAGDMPPPVPAPEAAQQADSSVPDEATAGQPHTAPRVPRQLPAPIRHFTGREAELAELTQLLEQAANQTHGPVLISAIDGTAGVGKTALAVQGAHEVAELFPDGQLFLNLRGYDPGEPVSPGEALARLLRTLGMPEQEIPPSDDERAARYRSMLAGQRMLVVLDNASDVEQVRPLLPGTVGCAALVTSRDSLSGLVARDGAQRLELGLLPPGDAASLLRALIGRRADADGSSAQALAERCCRLPLALRVAAEHAIARPEMSLDDLVSELTDQQGRLDMLDAGGDPRTAVRAVFSWSYHHLDPACASVFRLLGLHPGPDCDPYAAAALTGLSLAGARALLDRLARAHLVQLNSGHRVAMHDLLRAYAAELAVRCDSENQRHAALTRLLDHYLHHADIAAETLFPSRRRRVLHVSAPDTPVPQIAEPAAARAWLDAELPVLVAVSAYAAEHGWPSHAVQLSASLFFYLDVSGHYLEATRVHGNALIAARRTGDRAAEAAAVYGLGGVGMRQGATEPAIGYFLEALALYQTIGDAEREASTLTCLGNVEARAGRYDEAARYLRKVIAQSARPGAPDVDFRTLTVLGIIDERQGRYQQATGLFQRAAAVSRERGDPVGASVALNNLGYAEVRQGDYPGALTHIKEALSLAREAGYPVGEANALDSLGLFHLRQGRYLEAAGCFDQALAVTSDTGERNASAGILNHQAELMLETDRVGAAMDRSSAALATAVEIGDRYEQASSQAALARAREALGNPAQARWHWEAALQLYADLGAPEVDHIRERLRRASASAGSQVEG